AFRQIPPAIAFNRARRIFAKLTPQTAFERLTGSCIRSRRLFGHDSVLSVQAVTSQKLCLVFLKTPLQFSTFDGALRMNSLAAAKFADAGAKQACVFEF